MCRRRQLRLLWRRRRSAGRWTLEGRSKVAGWGEGSKRVQGECRELATLVAAALIREGKYGVTGRTRTKLKLFQGIVRNCIAWFAVEVAMASQMLLCRVGTVRKSSFLQGVAGSKGHGRD